MKKHYSKERKNLYNNKKRMNLNIENKYAKKNKMLVFFIDWTIKSRTFHKSGY